MESENIKIREDICNQIGAISQIIIDKKMYQEFFHVDNFNFILQSSYIDSFNKNFLAGLIYK